MSAAPSILVVDDNPAALKATVRILQQAGYEVAQAADGEQGLSRVRALRPKLVLLDVVLPGISGTEVLRQIRADPALADVSVVLLSSTAVNPDNQVAGLDAGADGYIARPIANAELLARVRSHLRQLQLTDQLRASEEKSQQLAERLTTTLESLTDGFFTLDRDWRFTYVNREAEQVFGMPRTELLGEHIWKKFPEARNSLSHHEYERAMRDDVAVQFETFYPSLGIWFEARAFPSKQGLAVHFRDVTAPRRANESLRLLSSAVEQSKESILITDAEIDLPGPRIVFANPAYTKMTGYTLADVLGKSPRFMQGLHTDKTVLARLRRNLERGEAFAGEAINYRKDGTEYVQEWQITPIRESGGKITHFVATQRDITERKQAEIALEKANQALIAMSRQAGMAEVATGVLHNVGNVLNSVNVSATLVANGVRQSKGANVAKLAALLHEHRADLAAFLTTDSRGRLIPDYLGTLAESLAAERETVIAELGHLRKNIDHIKDIVAMQQNHAKNSGLREKIALADLVEDALRMNVSSLARHDVQLVRDFQLRPEVHTDKHQVIQILINLVRNAQLACDEAGRTEKRITVRISGDATAVRISVCDNGVGIPPENLTRIFAHGFTTRKEGHGFGLHSGALAARELGGSLTVQSAGPGHGATFILELPCKLDSSSP